MRPLGMAGRGPGSQPAGRPPLAGLAAPGHAVFRPAAVQQGFLIGAPGAFESPCFLRMK